MQTQLSNRPFAPEIVQQPTAEERKLHYTKGRSIKHKTKDLVWSEVRWTTFVKVKDRTVVLDQDVKFPAVLRRAKSTERELVYVAP